MKILFATDLSEPATTTHTVEQMARRMKAELLVLHVCAPVPPSTDTFDPMTSLGGMPSYTVYEPEMQENLERAEENQFHRFLTERFKEPVRPAFRVGEPAQTILEDAEAEDVDLIAMGKHHRGRLERLLLSSAAKTVLSESTRPVLVLPIPRPEAEEER